MTATPNPRADASERETAAVKVEVDVTHRYGDLIVHDDIKFSVRENEFLCICGPSGCGKTTLLDILAGILRPSRGGVRIGGHPVDPKRDSISFVFQEPSTLPWLNVRDNVAAGLRIKKVPATEIVRRVDDIIGIVGLKGYEGYYPHQISGGMKQRVAWARKGYLEVGHDPRQVRAMAARHPVRRFRRRVAGWFCGIRRLALRDRPGYDLKTLGRPP